MAYAPQGIWHIALNSELVCDYFGLERNPMIWSSLDQLSDLVAKVSLYFRGRRRSRTSTTPGI